MKYASPYYRSIKKLNRAPSNMNRLCKDVEAWERKSIKYKKKYKTFDYTIMLDDNVKIDEEIFSKVEKIYLDFCREINDASKFNTMCKDYDKYRDYFRQNYPEYSKEFFREFEINWQVYYNKYKKLCKAACPDKQMLANIAVILCYEKYPSKNKKFIWKVANEGVLLNIKRCNINLPMRDDEGPLEYLGKRYSMMEVYNLDK